MKIYIMRHGTTVWNEKGIIQGRSRNQLSKSGKNLVLEKAKAHKNAKFDAVFVSPLMRTVQTANIMNQFHNAKIIKDERLTELDKGIFARRLKSSMTDQEQRQRMMDPKSCGCESYEEAYERTLSFYKFLKEQKYKSVLVVTHCLIATLLHDIVANNKIDLKDKDQSNRYQNAEIHCFEI